MFQSELSLGRRLVNIGTQPVSYSELISLTLKCVSPFTVRKPKYTAAAKTLLRGLSNITLDTSLRTFFPWKAVLQFFFLFGPYQLGTKKRSMTAILL